MKKTSHKILVLCGILGIGLAGIAMANGALEGDIPAMMVSPSTIVLTKVSIISVHTNIPASSVNIGSLSLKNVDADIDPATPTYVYKDNLGHIAAKFDVADLGLEAGEATLMLSGVYDGAPFSAIDVVTVK
jgi:hypothetical protein